MRGNGLGCALQAQRVEKKLETKDSDLDLVCGNLATVNDVWFHYRNLVLSQSILQEVAFMVQYAGYQYLDLLECIVCIHNGSPSHT